MLTTTNVWDWFALPSAQQAVCNISNINSLKQLLNNERGFVGTLEEALMLLGLSVEAERLTKLRARLEKQCAVFHQVDSDLLEEYSTHIAHSSTLLAARLPLDSDIYTYNKTLNRDIRLYHALATRSGVIYKSPSVTGRVRSDILRFGSDERYRLLVSRAGCDYQIVAYDYSAFEPSICLTKLVPLFQKGVDVYQSIAIQEKITRDEAKKRTLALWLWGDGYNENFKLFYRWRRQLYESAKTAGLYRLPSGEVYRLVDGDDEKKVANHYVQGYASEVARDVASRCVTLLANRKSYLAALVYDELIFAIHCDEENVRTQIKMILDSARIPTKEKIWAK